MHKRFSGRFAILLAGIWVPPTNGAADGQTLRFGAQDAETLSTIGAGRRSRQQGSRCGRRPGTPFEHVVCRACDEDGACPPPPFRKLARLDNRIATAISPFSRAIRGATRPEPPPSSRRVKRWSEAQGIPPYYLWAIRSFSRTERAGVVSTLAVSGASLRGLAAGRLRGRVGHTVLAFVERLCEVAAWDAVVLHLLAAGGGGGVSRSRVLRVAWARVARGRHSDM